MRSPTMPTCPICGGNIASTDQNCPYCGKTQLHLGGASDDASEWDLPMDDNTSLIAAQPAPWAPTPSPPPAAPPGGEDWLLPEAVLEPPPSADVSLPPWAPMSAPEPVPRQPTTFDFTFDLDSPGDAALAAAPPPAPFEPPAWQPPTANAYLPSPAPVITPVPVTPIPVTPFDAPPAFITPSPAPMPPTQPPPVFATPPPSAPALGDRVCPSCGKAFGQDYNDAYCLCGAELVVAAAPAPAPAPLLKAPAKRPAPQRPPTGTRCLVLYGADKQPVQFFALSKDAMLVGRLDAASGCFPEIDVSEYVDAATARKVSRKHALILRSRSSDDFMLRPLPGNTGTQVEKQMLSGPEDVPLTPGTRVVLGGAVRFKFEVM